MKYDQFYSDQKNKYDEQNLVLVPVLGKSFEIRAFFYHLFPFAMLENTTEGYIPSIGLESFSENEDGFIKPISFMSGDPDTYIKKIMRDQAQKFGNETEITIPILYGLEFNCIEPADYALSIAILHFYKILEESGCMDEFSNQIIASKRILHFLK